MTIPHLGARLARFKELPWVGDLRQLGMIAALELVLDKETKEPFRTEDRVGWGIYQAGLKEGLILRPLGNILYLWLPISTTVAEIDEITERMYRVIADPANLNGWRK